MEDISIGGWLRRRRKSLDMTQEELAQRVGCALITIAKFEAEQRRPSRQTALLLAEHLQVPENNQELFVDVVRGLKSAEQLGKIPPAGYTNTDGRQYAGPPSGEARLALSGELRTAALLGRISSTRLIGRQAELAVAQQAWAAARSGQAAALAVRGEPGIGKSRLAAELLKWVEAQGGAVFTGNCYSSGERSYAPFARILLNHAAFPTGLPPVVLADLRVIAPQLASRFPEAESTPGRDPLVEQLRLFESVYTWFRAAAGKRSMVILIEDLHWADAGTLELIRSLARRFRQSRTPSLLILTTREELSPGSLDLPGLFDELLRQHRLTTLQLKRLNQDETQEFLASIFQQEVTGEFIELVHRETQGTPFFIEEVCKELLESGDIYWGNNRWERKELTDLHLPQSVQFAIQTRLDKLPAPSLDALRMAAVLGRRFEFRLLQAALGWDEDALIEALETAQRSQFIADAEDVSHDSFDFTHNLIATALVESASTPRRRKLHRQAALAIENIHPNEYSLLAHHYREADDPLRTLQYLKLAAERAAAIYDYDQAQLFYTQSLGLAESDERETCRLLLARARVHDLCGRRADQLADLQAASARAVGLNDARLQAEIALAFAEYHIQVSDPPQVIEYARQAIGLSQQAQLPAIEARAGLLWGRALTETGELQEARQRLVMTGNLGRAAGLDEIEMRSLINLGNVDYLEGEYAAAGEKYRAALAAVRRTGERRVECMTLNNLGNVAWALGSLDQAVELYQHSLKIARQTGDRLNQARGLSNIGSILTEQYQYAQALVNLEQALGLVQELNQHLDEEIVLGHLSDAMEALGRYEAARGYREQAIQVAQGIEDLQGEAAMQAGLGRVQLFLGSLDAARQTAHQAIALAQAQGFRVEEAQAYQLLGLVCCEQADYAAAESAYQSALALQQALVQPQKCAELQAELARLAVRCGLQQLARARLAQALPGADLQNLEAITEPTLCLCAALVLEQDDPSAARLALDNGWQSLQTTAAKITDPAGREHYLAAIPNHRELARLWRAEFGQ